MVTHVASARPTGLLQLSVIRAERTPDISLWPTRPLTLAEVSKYGGSQRELSDEVNRWRRANWTNLARGLRKIIPARAFGIPHFYGTLFLSLFRANGEVVDYGLASLRVVTTVGVRFICDDLNNSTTDVSLFKFHGLGTGGTAEAVGDTALVTEITTQYSTDNTRPTGTQASATVSTNATYTTVGTITVDASVAATEHGILSQAATGGGTLLDRSLFTVVNLASGDSLQATYVLTVNSGG
jgi:hypothetical protein